MGMFYPVEPITINPKAPTAFAFTKDESSIRISWSWGGYDDGGGLLYGSGSSSAVALPCSGFCDSETTFSVEVSEDDSSFRVVAEGLSYKSYYFSLAGYSKHVFRVRAVKKINGENKYSDYLVSPPIIVPEVKKLPKPIIAPSTSTIRYNTYVSITSEPSATIFYKTIGLGSSCSNGDGWKVYKNAFKLSSSANVCAKAHKSGWKDSDAQSKSYTLQLEPPIINVTTPLVDGAKVSIYSQQNASIKYKLVSRGSSCTNGSVNSYSSPITLRASQKVCAYTVKAGWKSSDTVSKDYLLKLNKPSIKPDLNKVTAGDNITITSNQNATIKYKLISLNASCTNSGWQSSAPVFSLTQSKRVCAKAVKSNWSDSDITFKDFTVLLTPHSTLTTQTPNDASNFIDTVAPSSQLIGTLEGQAGVSGGASTYHIPIQLPPGRAGMQPEVSLNYSSRSGNGIAGMGWSLSASSSITRCAATYAQDGFIQNPQYNSNDRLCLDGQRLINTSGSYGSSGTEYRTEIDSFVRVTQSGSLNGSSTWFRVEYKNGRVAYFGKTTNSRLIHGSKVAAYSWLLEYQHDVMEKNYIHYEYDEFGLGQLMLKKILYSGKSRTDKGDRIVEFNYSTDRTDTSLNYLNGGVSYTTVLLNSIKTYMGNTLVKRYGLSYGESQSTARSHLKTIELCDYSGSYHCTPKTHFSMSDPTLNWEGVNIDSLADSVFSNVGGLNSSSKGELSQKNRVIYKDLNGDGIAELLKIVRNGSASINVDVYTLLNDSYTYLKTLEDNISHLIFTAVEGDINNDGIADFTTSENRYLVYIQYDDHFNATKVTTNFQLNHGYENIQSTNARIFDIDGDGWQDIVLTNYFNNDESYVGYYKSRGEGQINFYSFSELYKLNKRSFNTGQSLFQQASWDDMNGDGLLDLMLTYQADDSIKEISIAFTEIINGQAQLNEYFSEELGLPINNFYNQFVFADLNGDGLKDFVRAAKAGNTYEWQVQLNNGNYSFLPLSSLGTGIGIHEWQINSLLYTNNSLQYRVQAKFGGLQVGDLDSDGKDELLVATNSEDDYCVNILGRIVQRDYYIESCNDDIQMHEHRNTESSAEKLEIDLSNLDLRRFNWTMIDFENNSNSTEIRRSFANVVKAPIGRASIYGNEVFRPLEITDYNNDGYLDFSFSTFKNITFANGNFTINGYSFEQGGMSGNLRSTGVNGFFIKTNKLTDNNELPEILHKVTDGLKRESTWEYANLSTPMHEDNLSLYDTPDNRAERYLSGDIAQGYIYFTSSMPIVSSFIDFDGTDIAQHKKYFYREAVYSRQGRGFMGFKSIIEKDVNRALVTQTDFEQIFPYQGKLKRQATFTEDDYTTRGSGHLGISDNETYAVSYSNTEWQENSTHSVTDVYNLYPIETTQITRDLVTKQDLTRIEKNITRLDQYGNVTASSTQVEDAWGTYTTSETREYEGNESNWWLNKLNTKIQTKARVAGRSTNDPITDADLDQETSIRSEYSNYHGSRQPQTITTTATLGGSSSGYGSEIDTIYNAYGLPLSVSQTTKVRNSSGSWIDQTRTTSTTYSKDGTVEATDGYFPYKQTNAKGHISYTEVNPATGQITQTRQQLSSNSYQVTNFGYDDYNRPYSIQTDGSPARYSAMQTPDAQAPANAIIQVLNVSAGQPMQKIYLDALGRTLRTAVQNFDGDWVFSDVNYNSLGYKTFESMPYKEEGAVYGTSYTEHDALGRVIEKVTNQHCGNMTTNYSYSGLKTDIEVYDSCYGITLDMSRTYNSLKQLMQTVDADDGVTRYSYNNQGLPIVIQDANGNNIEATYNGLGQKTQVDDPNQGVTNFEYNGFGELQREARVGSKTLTYVTDVLGRVTRRTATGENTLTYTYDSATYGLGQLNQAVGNGVTKTYTYDSRGRPSGQTVAGSGKSYTTTTFYDRNYGRVKGLRYPNNLTLEYRYNDVGYQTQVKNAASGYVYKNITEFDIFGNGSQNTLGNGLTENTAYSNKSGQMLLKTIAKNNSNIMNIDYSAYDGFGNLKAVDITTGNIGNQHSFSETYDYDALHRLESNAVNGISTINYSYDAVGNLLSKSDYATQYDYENGATGGPNAVKRVYRGGWKSFGYDTRGNMTSGDGLTNATYNAMDKPTQIIKSGKTLNFTYGPQHMRFKQVNGSVTTFYSDKLYEEEVTGTKTTWRAYIDDIAVISQTTNEGATIRYTHRDRLGSARVFTDHNGQVEAERNYDPFGKPRLASGGLKSFGASKLGDLADAKTNRGFTDHEHLDSVELIHMNGRVYDYSLGRFMSVDPVIQSPTNSQSINPYSYIMNNPLSGTDPTGYTSCDADDPENCQEVAEELGKDEKADITQRQSVAGSRIKRNVKVGTMTGNGNGTVNVQIGNMSATADIGAPASNNKGANSTNQNDDAQKSLIVGITGGGGHKSGAGPDLLNLAEQYKDDDGVDVQTFEWDDSKAARKAIINFRKDNPEGRVVLMGYSLGGRAAVNIANKLGKKDISIDSLVTFDAYSFVGSSHKLRYNSVKQALNFYQQNPTDRSWGISPAGASNPYPGSVINSKHINVINHNYTGDSRGINHINIIDYAIRDYGGQINDHIK